ncbi:hypothetical protein CH063_14026 [Colletotrichum higginsianum]|uniref:Uncharacterized protein n=1 Tax=Colletotrichum higginsianum (strain IMI 349063) TaxID=759273 RepID=H1VWV4_COLHI|nr:hypothetical protein CH063_14026 [Colletotrichum higginsianum]
MQNMPQQFNWRRGGGGGDARQKSVRRAPPPPRLTATTTQSKAGPGPEEGVGGGGFLFKKNYQLEVTHQRRLQQSASQSISQSSWCGGKRVIPAAGH